MTSFSGFQQQLFPSVPSIVDFNCAIIFRSVHLDFLCAYLAALITSYLLFSNLRCAHCMIHAGNCSLAPSPVVVNRPNISRSLLLEFSCANPATPIAQDHVFRNLSRHAQATRKNPLAPSPANLGRGDCARSTLHIISKKLLCAAHRTELQIS